jgi:hypothetical protein
LQLPKDSPAKLGFKGPCFTPQNPKKSEPEAKGDSAPRECGVLCGLIVGGIEWAAAAACKAATPAGGLAGIGLCGLAVGAIVGAGEYMYEKLGTTAWDWAEFFQKVIDKALETALLALGIGTLAKYSKQILSGLQWLGAEMAEVIGARFGPKAGDIVLNGFDSLTRYMERFFRSSKE